MKKLICSRSLYSLPAAVQRCGGAPTTIDRIVTCEQQFIRALWLSILKVLTYFILSITIQIQGTFKCMCSV